MQITIKDSKEKKYEIKINFQNEEKEENIEKATTIHVLEERHRTKKKLMPDGSYTYTFESEDPAEVIAILIGILNAIGILKAEKDFINIVSKDNDFKTRIGEFYKKFWVYENSIQEK